MAIDEENWLVPDDLHPIWKEQGLLPKQAVFRAFVVQRLQKVLSQN